MLLLIAAYRTVASAHLGGACRFEPSCSEHAVQAYRTHPPLRATKLMVSRVLRCRPGCAGGFDPVPEPRIEIEASHDRKGSHDPKSE